ncbi:MAG: RNA polymerase sigma factor [Deltaproteobacteria bacterium]|nr:RNA polymerase sigma factor [Deltaproteobacteria bacterium]
MTDLHPTDDASLVVRAQRGDEVAFETLYRRHRDFVTAVAARFGADGADALDVLQETFLYFLRKLPSFELRAELRTFLYPVAKHTALKRKGRAARQQPLDPEDPAVANLPAKENGHTQRRRVEELVAELSDGRREVVMLRFVDGLSLDEIAEALGIPLGTVKSRLHHALRALRAAEEG